MHRSYTYHPLTGVADTRVCNAQNAIPINSGVADTRVCNAQKLYPSTQVSPPPEFVMHRSYTHPLIGVADTRVCNAQKLYLSTQVSPTPEFVLNRMIYLPIYLGVIDTRVCNALLTCHGHSTLLCGDYTRCLKTAIFHLNFSLTLYSIY